MKNRYQIVDNPFNRANYPDLIGKVVDNPPAYAKVSLIKEKLSMEEIFKRQTKFFTEDNTDTMSSDFVIKCIKEGYEKEEIIEGLRQFYHQSPESGRDIFGRTVIKYLKLEDKVTTTATTAKFNLKKYMKRSA